jgi:hypothetical protein
VAATTIAAIGVASSIAGSVQARGDARDAARTQQRGYDAASAEQSRQFDLGREDTAPFRQVGTAAVNQLAQLYGLGPAVQQQQQQAQQLADQATSLVGDTELPVYGRRIVPVGRGRYEVYYGDEKVGDLVPGGNNGRFVGNGTAIPQPTMQSVPGFEIADKTSMGPTGTPGGTARAGTPDYSAFLNSPDYAFARDEGTRGIERSAAARGGIASGNTLASLARFNSGLATQNYGNYTNRLAALANVGQTSSENLASRRDQLGANTANNFIGGAGSRASGIAGRSQGLQNLGSELTGFGGYLSSFRNPGTQYRGGLTSGQIDSIFAPRAYPYAMEGT